MDLMQHMLVEFIFVISSVGAMFGVAFTLSSWHLSKHPDPFTFVLCEFSVVEFFHHAIVYATALVCGLIHTFVPLDPDVLPAPLLPLSPRDKRNKNI